MTSLTRAFDDLVVDYVEFYVQDVASSVSWLVEGYGFAVHATTPPRQESRARTVALTQGAIRLLVTEPLATGHPAAAYVDEHGDGVANIGLRVADADLAFREALLRGARPVHEPTLRDGVRTAAIRSFGDVTHTFVQRPVGPAAHGPSTTGLKTIDHFAVCLQPGRMRETLGFYRDVLDFELILTERIEIGSQAMTIEVVRSTSGGMTLTLIEPDASSETSHLSEFLERNAGAGVQHMALSTDDIIASVGAIGARGIEFLPTPDAYYRRLWERVRLSRHTPEEICGLNVLVDADHDGQLYQIFARSVTPRGTFFMEIIERAGSNSFGSGNIKSLYQAVESQRTADQHVSDGVG